MADETPKASTKMQSVELKTKYWPADGSEPVDVGVVADFPFDEAKKMVANGIAVAAMSAK